MADDYARAALRVASAQLAEAAGFTAARSSAVEALADVAVRYARAVGRGAAAHAELAGRATAHAGDVTAALADLGTTIPDLATYMVSVPDIPFAHGTLPRFPVTRAAAPGAPPPPPTWDALGETAPPHVPPFLPAFPDRHSYAATPLFPGHDTSAAAAAAATAAAAAAGEAALVGLARRAAGEAGGAQGPSVAAAVAAAIAAGGGARPDPGALATGRAALETAPFTEDALAAGKARAEAGTVPKGSGGGPTPGEEAPPAGGRRAGKRGTVDAATARAEALLEAGSDAMALEDDG